MANKNIVDIITDDDVVPFRDPNNLPDAKIDEKGIIRNSLGQIVKGSQPLHRGRPKRLRSLDKFIERKMGPDAERLVQKLVEIALYDPDMPMIDYDKKTGETITKKKTWHYYSAGHQIEALRLLASYYFGRPKESIEIDKNVNINIEKKVGMVTKLINENHERLQVVSGGKDTDG